MPGATSSRSEQPRSSRASRFALAVGCPALLAVVCFAIRSTTGEAKPPFAPRTEAPPDSVADREAPRGAIPSEKVAVDTTNDEPESFEDDANAEEEEPDRLENRLSAEVLLLENRRRAHDRLEASANSSRLSATDRAALDARRAALSEKLALHEQRVERLKQEVGSDESGYEAQNGIP